MTEADIVQRLREMQADMNDAIEKMDASAFDTGMMRQIRAEQHDFYKEAADEIERLRAEVEALRADAERLNFVEQTFIEEGIGLELYPFGVDEQYAEDGNTVIDRLFVFGGNGRVGPTLRAAIDAAMAQAKDAEARG